jgi:alpha-ketoglutarate-dependent taurine dioxygenase
MHSYPGVNSRLLADTERDLRSSETETPLVLEASGRRDLPHLHSVLTEHAAQIIDDAARHGAVLLRGFEVNTDQDFESTVLALRGMRGIAQVFMAEGGRTLVDGTRFVLHTNSIYTTGGSFDLCAFHTENYFVPDVPRFIFFFCRRPSALGGETGLVNTAKVFAALPEAVKEKLRRARCLANAFPVSEVAARYGIDVRAAEAIVLQAGMAIEEHEGRRYMMMHKPSVLVHPLTGEPSLDIHYYNGLMGLGLTAKIRDVFEPDYAGARWALHRLLWRHPPLTYLVPSLALFRAPAVVIRNYSRAIWERVRVRVGHKIEAGGPPGVHVSSAFDRTDVALVAQAMRRHFASFRWQRGDVLMVDNTKMAHAGMPGFGPRLLRAMICNPVQIPYAADGSGQWQVPIDDVDRTVGERFDPL